MDGEKPTWTLVAHIGIIGHDRVLVSLAAPHHINHLMKEGNVNYNTLKPVLFEFPTYEYLRTGEIIGKCLSLKEEYDATK